MSDQPQPAAAIDVQLKFFFLAFLLLFFKPKLHIDRTQAIEHGWSTRRYPVAPGRHELRAYVPYLFLRTMGDSAVVVDVAPGQVVRVRWHAPWLVFLPGTWKVQGATPISGGPAVPLAAAATIAPQAGGPPPAAAWHPDPVGRHQLRYWNGHGWTANVSDNGVTGTDPL